MNNSVVERIWALAEPLVTEYGMEIVDIDYRREARGHVLRLYLGRENGHVTLDELTAMNRRIGHLVEAHAAIPGRYVLEVSSPGINRRLRRPAHFRRFIGKRVRVRTHERVLDRRSFLGTLQAVDDHGIVVRTDHEEVLISYDNITQANYEHDFGAEPLASGKFAEPR